MSIEFDLKTIERKVNYAAYQDGLMEILLGVFLIFFGGSLTVGTTIIPFIVIAIFFGKPILNRIKNKWIYPRAGYVKLPQEDDVDTRGIGIAALVFVILLLGSLGVSLYILGIEAGMSFWRSYILPPSTGFMLAIGPFWLGQTYSLVRGYLYAALFIISGILIPISGFASGYEAVGLICTFVGTIIMVAGIFMFTRFLKRYPPQTEGA